MHTQAYVEDLTAIAIESVTAAAGVPVLAQDSGKDFFADSENDIFVRVTYKMNEGKIYVSTHVRDSDRVASRSTRLEERRAKIDAALETLFPA